MQISLCFGECEGFGGMGEQGGLFGTWIRYMSSIFFGDTMVPNIE